MSIKVFTKIEEEWWYWCVILKHRGGFLSSASFIFCITHYNFVPHSGSGSSFYCFHFIRFPLVFLLNAAVLFFLAPLLHLSDSPTSYRGGGWWERAPSASRRDWLFLACPSANCLRVFGCVSYSGSISLINPTALHPKALLMALLMSGPWGARQFPQVRTYDWLSQRWRWLSIGCLDQCRMPQNMNKCPHPSNHSLVSRRWVVWSLTADLFSPAVTLNC